MNFSGYLYSERQFLNNNSAPACAPRCYTHHSATGSIAQTATCDRGILIAAPAQRHPFCVCLWFFTALSVTNSALRPTYSRLEIALQVTAKNQLASVKRRFVPCDRAEAKTSETSSSKKLHPRVARVVEQQVSLTLISSIFRDRSC